MVSKHSLQTGDFDELPKDSHFLKSKIIKRHQRKLDALFDIHAIQGWVLYALFKDRNMGKDKSGEIELGEDKAYIVTLKPIKSIVLKDLMNDQSANRQAIQNLMNGLLSQNLEDNGLFTLGKSSNFFSDKNFVNIQKLNLKVYLGNSYKVNLTEAGMNLVINPKCRIIRGQTAWEEYCSCPHYLKQNFFKYKEAFCIYNRRLVVLNGIDHEINLQSKFPSIQFKNY